jgi:hypothetical protein
MGLCFQARFWTKLHLCGFLFSRPPNVYCQPLCDETSSFGKIVGSLHWNPSSSTLVQNLAASSLRAGLSKVLCRYSTFLPTLSQGEGTRDSRVAIDRFQWPLRGRYLLEFYLTPCSLDSPCASHSLLAIKEHLVCGANSHWFDCAQILSCKLTVIFHGPLGCLLLSVTISLLRKKTDC